MLKNVTLDNPASARCRDRFYTKMAEYFVVIRAFTGGRKVTDKMFLSGFRTQSSGFLLFLVNCTTMLVAIIEHSLRCNIEAKIIIYGIHEWRDSHCAMRLLETLQMIQVRKTVLT